MIPGDPACHLYQVSFDAYNESGSLIEAVERYKLRTGSYPERVQADQIYRTRDNRAYCKDHGIRLSGPKLGRPSPNIKTDKDFDTPVSKERARAKRTTKYGDEFLVFIQDYQ